MKLKFFLIFCLFLAGCKGFHPRQIRASIENRKEWEIPISEQQLLFLPDTFHYLGNGAQGIVFESEDQKYVLKFFKMKHLTAKKWLKYLPARSDYRFRKTERREKRLEALFSIFKTAYEQFPEETGLKMVHLNQTEHLKKKIRLIDKKNKEWEVDLDTVPFVVQERAELFFSRLEAEIQKQDFGRAKSCIAAALRFIEERSQKGYTDLDSGFGNNYGFVGDKIIQIDIGRMVQGSSDEQERVRKQIFHWVEKHHPFLTAEIFSKAGGSSL